MAMRLDGSSSQSSELLYVGFNQDQGCFACGTDSGFRIFNCDPFKQTYRRDFPNGGIGIVEMLFRCNILALVGGGRNPRYPPNKVMVWDDHQNRCIGELSFRSEVKAVRMSRERVVVVLEYKIYVYNFADLNLLHTIETASNPRGLCSLCPDSRACVLACPGLQKGHVKVELFDITRTTIVPAHESSLGYLATNLDGTRLATASERGTLVRVWDTKSGQRLHELRRGAEPADIQCISFSHDLMWLLVSSDHGTVHLFRLGDDADASAAAAAPPAGPPGAGAGADSAADNPRSNFAFLGSVLPKAITPTYFQSQWSFAQFRLPGSELGGRSCRRVRSGRRRRRSRRSLPVGGGGGGLFPRRQRLHTRVRSPPTARHARRSGSEKTLTKNICAFGPPGSHTFLVVSADGTFFKCSFDPVRGGDCTREDWQRFLLPEEDE